EQRTENPRVTGSIPVLGIFYFKISDQRYFPFYICVTLMKWWMRNDAVLSVNLKLRFFIIF
ncbi:MAG: hypothetical protein IKQ25_10265, partial [Lachnospiraceae bacterium]|nr:hypothetical protein [Lachnospiraceae bacterium]